MTYGIIKLNDQKKALFDSINRLFVEELTVKIRSELAAIEQPDLQPNQNVIMTSTWSRLDDLLHTLNRSDIIPHAKDLIIHINNILDKIGDEEIVSLFNSVSAVIKQVEEHDVIGKISNALDLINSLDGLRQFAEKLQDFAGSSMFASAGPLGAVLLKVVGGRLAGSRRSELRELINVNKEQVILEAMNAYFAAGVAWMKAKKLSATRLYQDLNDSERQRFNNILQGSVNFLEMPPPSREIIDYMKIALSHYEDLITELYSDEYNQKDVSSVLNNISKSAVNPRVWDEILDGVIYQKKNFDRDIIFDHGEMNYELARRLYGRRNTDSVMKLTVQLFRREGMDELIDILADSFSDYAACFRNIVCNIPAGLSNDSSYIIETSNFPHKIRDSARGIWRFYHAEERGALEFVAAEWNKLRRQDPNILLLSPEAVDVIILRAFLECCREKAKLMFAPHNIPREIGKGAKDFFVGIGRTVRHPIDALVNTVTLPYDLITDRNSRRSAMRSAIYNHPVRFTTSLLFSGAVSVGASAGIHSLVSSLSSGSHATFLPAPEPSMVPTYAANTATTSVAVSDRLAWRPDCKGILSERSENAESEALENQLSLLKLPITYEHSIKSLEFLESLEKKYSAASGSGRDYHETKSSSVFAMTKRRPNFFDDSNQLTEDEMKLERTGVLRPAGRG